MKYEPHAEGFVIAGRCPTHVPDLPHIASQAPFMKSKMNG